MTLRSSIRSFDTQVSAWVNSLFTHDVWLSVFRLITVLGDPITIILIASGVILAGFYQNSARIILSGAIIPITVTIGGLIKLLFERARPVSEYSTNLGTFSFPSGHSSGSMIAFGLLAYFAFMKLPGPWGIVAACSLSIVPIAVGISRIYLGAHYPSDVVAGWLLGIVGLLIIIFGIRPL